MICFLFSPISLRLLDLTKLSLSEFVWLNLFRASTSDKTIKTENERRKSKINQLNTMRGFMSLLHSEIVFFSLLSLLHSRSHHDKTEIQKTTK